MKSEQNSRSLSPQALFGPGFLKVKPGVGMPGSVSAGASGPGFSTILSGLDAGNSEDWNLEPGEESVLAGATLLSVGSPASEQPAAGTGLTDSAGLPDQRFGLDGCVADLSLEGAAMAGLAGLISDSHQFSKASMARPSAQAPFVSGAVDASQAENMSVIRRGVAGPLGQFQSQNEVLSSQAPGGGAVAKDYRSANALIDSPEPEKLLAQSGSWSGRTQGLSLSSSEPRSSVIALGENSQNDTGREYLEHFQAQRSIQVVESNLPVRSAGGEPLASSSPSRPNSAMWRPEKSVPVEDRAAHGNSIPSALSPHRGRMPNDATESNVARLLDDLGKFASTVTDRPVALKPVNEALPENSTELASIRTSDSENEHIDEGLWAPQALFSGGRINYSAPLDVAPAALPEGLADQVKYWISNDVQTAELRLDGFDGATVDVSISMQGNETRIGFRSDQIEIREILENSSHQLKDSLAREGLLLADVFVGGSNHHHGNSPKPGQEHAARIATAVEPEPVNDTAALIRRDPVKRTLDVFV